jgi:hypothetical protein
MNMKNIIVICVFMLLIFVSIAYADLQQKRAFLGLEVPQIIELVGVDMEEIIVPGPEDYARDLQVARVVNDPQSAGQRPAAEPIADNTGGEAARDNAMYDANHDIGKGFAERTDAFSMTIFTNSQDGAVLYVHGVQPDKDILRLEDTYLSICTEKTYILLNDLEGAYANACSVVYMELDNRHLTYNTGGYNRSTGTVEDNPRNDMGGPVVKNNNGKIVAVRQLATGSNTVAKAASTWLRVHNQAQHLFEVKMATKAPRLISINVGVANLARYTEGTYSNELVFTLMPIVG